MSERFDSVLGQGWRTTEFRYAAIGRLVFGRGTAIHRLRDYLVEAGIARALLVAPPGLRSTQEIAASLAEDIATPTCEVVSRDLEMLEEIAERATDLRAQALIALGDTAVVDAVKGASIVLSNVGGAGEVVDQLSRGALTRELLDAQKIPIFSIPTELEGAGFSGTTEISTDAGRGMYSSPTLYARAVFLDGDVAAETPRREWAATGLKLLDHAVERIMSTTSNPLIDVHSVVGMRVIDRHLAASLEPADPLMRQALLGALWLIQSNNGTVGGGYSHSLSRELRSCCGAPLGVGTAIFLPAVLRWCSEAARSRYGILAEGLGIEAADPIEAVISRVDGIIADVGLRLRLRDLGVNAERIGVMAQRSFADRNVRSSPWQPRDADELASLIATLY